MKCYICDTDLSDETNELCSDCKDAIQKKKSKYIYDNTSTDKKISDECKRLNGQLHKGNKQQNELTIAQSYYALYLIAKDQNYSKLIPRLEKHVKDVKEEYYRRKRKKIKPIIN